jgi:hypothetical protein
VPDAEPLPDVTCIHVAVVAAVHAHPVLVVTVNEPPPPEAAIVPLPVGDSE